MTPPSARAGTIFTDEWWTTAQVLSFLKMKRKALWELRQRPERSFPAPARFGGKFNLYPALAVQQWADRQQRGARRRTPEKKERGFPIADPKGPSVPSTPAPESPAAAMAPARNTGRLPTMSANQPDLFG